MDEGTGLGERIAENLVKAMDRVDEGKSDGNDCLTWADKLVAFYERMNRTK